MERDGGIGRARLLRSLTESRRRWGVSDYASLLPFGIPDVLRDAQIGGTPLIQSRRIGGLLGIPCLYFKMETANPSGSFKDREALSMFSHALYEGYERGIVASSGNAAAAVAFMSALTGMPCSVLYEEGHVHTKLMQAFLYGSRPVAVEGLFSEEEDRLIHLIREVSRSAGAYPFFCYAPVNPYSREGVRLISYETVSELGCCPDAVVAPVGGGDCISGQYLGYRDLVDAGVIDRVPRMIGVQAEGAAPLARSWREGLDSVRPVAQCETVASGIRVRFSGRHAMEAVRESNGAAVAVSDEDVLKAEAQLARMEGIWVEPTSSTVVAALPGLLRAGIITPRDRVVCVLTGHGFKDVDVLTGLVKPGARAAFSPADITAVIGPTAVDSGPGSGVEHSSRK